MITLTEEQVRLISQVLRSHLVFWRLNRSMMEGSDYETDLGVETIAKADKEVSDTLKALSYL